MKTVSHPKQSVISVRGLVLIYFLLCILTVFFSRSFFSETLRDGSIPSPLNLVVFFTIPAVLLVFLAVSVASLVRDLVTQRTGSKFKARLLAYFITVVVFAAAPVTLVTNLGVGEMIRFWRSIDSGAAMGAAESFAVENYSLHSERFETIIRGADFSPYLAPDETAPAATGEERPAGVPPLPPGIAAAEEFREDEDGAWRSRAFAGEESGRLAAPPLLYSGFVPRELPRDRGLIRYAIRDTDTVRVISYSLGEDFDRGMEAIQNEKVHFEIIDSLRVNYRRFMIFFYGVFFFPSLLMTIIIAISFTRRVTAPIVELTEATRRVAEGDFSIQILARRGDELGLLIRSFNSMVQDLKKSREALFKAEKITIWQNMAQQLAHEIKNPLTPIKLSAERVLRRWRDDPGRTGEILESSMLAIIQETEGLSTLLTEFRTLSKPMEPSGSWTRLREAAEAITAPYTVSYPGVRFDTEYMDGGILVKMDQHRVSQVLTNLVINAIDAMNGEGSIELRTDLVKKHETRYCRLSVKDTGKGISAEEGPLVFTPYYTTKESGTGLGLPIVERIIGDHGGAIWFDSREGTGTTFFIDLPIEEGGGTDSEQ
ncbi:MAG: HAMP domain-containing protein [Treponema sp.]|jgi:nitrogen fixation/metabolism regulation signal transduction histidine kinase|nr:HAMP domain-containing protein [Treponema sp.]